MRDLILFIQFFFLLYAKFLVANNEISLKKNQDHHPSTIDQLERDLLQTKAVLTTLDKDLITKQKEFDHYFEKLTLINKQLEEQHSKLKDIKLKAFREYQYFDQQIKFYMMKSSYQDNDSIIETTTLSKLVPYWKLKFNEIKDLLHNIDVMQDQYAQFKEQQKNVAESITVLQEFLLSRKESKAINLEKMNQLTQATQEGLHQQTNEKVNLYKQQVTHQFNLKKFSSPFQQLSYQKNDKGVNFLAREQSDILAPKDGEVVYIGELSNYGKVLLINHEDEYKSIILAPAQWQVFLGQKVVRGEKIGTLLKDIQSFKDQELYYELRKGKASIDTIEYVDLY